MGLDLTALEGLNIPEINIDPKDQYEVDSSLPIEGEESKEKVENTIGEADSIEEFGKEETPDKEVILEEGEPVAAEAEPVEGQETQESTEGADEVSIVRGLAEWAKTEQIFDYADDEFQDSPDFLKSKIEEVAEAKAAKRFEEKLAEDPDVLIELRKNFKEGVPLDELIYTESRIIEYSGYTEDQIKEDVRLQKKLVIENLMNNDYTEEEASTRADKYEDSGILDEEALVSHKKLVTFEKKYKQNLIDETKRAEEAQKVEYQNKIKQIETQITSMDEIIPGIPISKEEKQKLIDGYLKPDKNRKTELMKMIEKDPMAQLKIAQFFLQLNGNLDKVKTVAKTQAIQQTKKAVTTYKDTPGIGKLNYDTIKRAVESARKQRQ